MLRLLARGGMSRVYLARDRTTGGRVAIKLLDADLSQSIEHRERFRREAKIATVLDHANIVPCIGAVHRVDAALAVMPYVAGPSLAVLLERHARLPWHQVFAGLIPVAGGTVHWKGEDITGMPAEQSVRKGLGRGDVWDELLQLCLRFARAPAASRPVRTAPSTRPVSAART